MQQSNWYPYNGQPPPQNGIAQGYPPNFPMPGQGPPMQGPGTLLRSRRSSETVRPEQCEKACVEIVLIHGFVHPTLYLICSLALASPIAHATLPKGSLW